MSNIDELTPEEALAEELVDEALSGFRLSPDLRAVVRVTVLCEMLTCPVWLARLRHLLRSPQSGHLEKKPARGSESG